MSDAAIAELARLIEAASGNVVPPGHYPFLVGIAGQRARATGCPDAWTYVRSLTLGQLPGEWAALLPHITVKESFCFRTPQHFARLTDTLLPRLVPRRAGARRLRVWSAGCARGEEPATLALVLAETPALAGWDWRVVGTDVDQEALAVARGGRFSERAVALVPPALLARHFTPRAGAFELSAPLQRRIEYNVLNLVAEPFPSPDEPFDIVFLRNVLIYFRADSQRRVVAAVARALAPDGFLVVGPSETLWQLTEELEPEDLGDCFCYRRAAPRPTRGPKPVARGPRPVARDPEPIRPGGAEDSRLSTRNSRPSGSRGPEAVTQALGTRDRLGVAARHLAANRSDEAARLVTEAIAADPSEASAHALEGLLHDVCGRPEQAVASYRAALYLDPALFQARLLLADALRRSGHHARAAQEYRQVLTLVGAPRARDLDELAPLPLPDRATAAQRARAALAAG